MEARPFSDTSFDRFLDEEKLMGSRCDTCGALFVPPRPLCIACGGSEMEWVKMRGTGTLRAFTCIAVGPPAMRQEGYGRARPYCTGVVELDEGCRVVARIEDVNTNDPQTISIGMPVTVMFLHRGEGPDKTTYLAFKPAEGSEP
ncbi:MAG: Zn-ribbon domain-containing OB-fold protein [Desulfomonile tiedjei]|nr:Zn-ribbon domain-containing OB-fold protein [Desulfomonile tiedjei]